NARRFGRVVRTHGDLEVDGGEITLGIVAGDDVVVDAGAAGLDVADLHGPAAQGGRVDVVGLDDDVAANVSGCAAGLERGAIDQAEAEPDGVVDEEVVLHDAAAAHLEAVRRALG